MMVIARIFSIFMSRNYGKFTPGQHGAQYSDQAPLGNT